MLEMSLLKKGESSLYPHRQGQKPIPRKDTGKIVSSWRIVEQVSQTLSLFQT